MKTILSVLTAFASINTALATGVELSCNSEALVVTHQFDSNDGENYTIAIGNQGVIDYFNKTAGVFLNQSHLKYAPGSTIALMTSGYVRNGSYEAVMYRIGSDRDRRPDHSLPTYVKVSRRGAGALVETFLPQIGAGPNWFFESCQ